MSIDYDKSKCVCTTDKKVSPFCLECKVWRHKLAMSVLNLYNNDLEMLFSLLQSHRAQQDTLEYYERKYAEQEKADDHV